MVFENEINIYNPDAIKNEFHTQATQISATQGKIGAMISDSQIQELQNGKTTMFDRLVSAEMDIDGISTQVSSLRQADGELESQISTIRQTANSINAEVTSVKNNYVHKAQIILAINNITQESETVISSDHISLAGKTINLTSDNMTINSTYFKVDKYGRMTAQAGTFYGDIIIKDSNDNEIGYWKKTGFYATNSWKLSTDGLAAGSKVEFEGGSFSLRDRTGSFDNTTAAQIYRGLKITSTGQTYNETLYLIPVGRNGTSWSGVGVRSASGILASGRLAIVALADGSAGSGATILMNEAGVHLRNQNSWMSVYDGAIDLCPKTGSNSSGSVRIDSSGYNGANKLTASYMQVKQTLDAKNINVENLYTTGGKTRQVETKDYGSRLLYCYETPAPLFGDVGEGIIAEDGKSYIIIDSIFRETITTSQYQVFLQKYGEGECYVSERNSDYFVVEGTPGLKYGWEIKARQKDLDQWRIERKPEEMVTDNVVDYAMDLINHISDLQATREEGIAA